MCEPLHYHDGDLLGRMAYEVFHLVPLPKLCMLLTTNNVDVIHHDDLDVPFVAHTHLDQRIYLSAQITVPNTHYTYMHTEIHN